MIFETERLLVRKLHLDDLLAFHEMESNPNVLKFADGEIKTISQNKIELNELIDKYSIVKNDFWIYAIERKIDKNFIGTVAFVKDNKDDEIGYRFLEKYWSRGYGTEICVGIIQFCKKMKMKKIVAYAADENIATVKILEKNNFKILKQFINDESQKETKYILIL